MQSDPVPAAVVAKPYELGMNCAGETAGQVANYILADLRVYLRGQPIGTQLLDDAGERIYKACREAAISGRQPLLAALLMQNSIPAEPAAKEGG